MTFNDACEKAIAFTRAETMKSIRSAFETNEYYLFDIRCDGEVYCSPIGVNKKTGETIIYFPPDHSDDLKTAKKTEVPQKYKKDDAE